MDYKARAKEILKNLTLPEKIALQTGADMWHTVDLTAKDVPQILMCDGPHGLRRVENQVGGGFETSAPAVSFPTASKLACSFDRQLIFEVGKALGEQCRSQDVAVLLGPGVNIKRNALCGRNFEYFSEDPFLTGEIATAYVNGVQSQDVGTSLKHFAANSQEFARMVCDSQVDERALREIYLSAFEKVIEEAKPWTVMCAYNKLNGEYCSENKRLLTDILREQWGFNGMVVSDWGAVNNRAEGLKAGLDLMMPHADTEAVKHALSEGELSEEDIDACVLKIIELVLKSQERKPLELDFEAQHQLAGKVSAECTVLAKNSCDILPLSKKAKIAVIGGFAKNPHIQGGGSSKVNAFKTTTICDAFEDEGIDFVFAQGYKPNDIFGEAGLIAEAAKVASLCDAVLLVVGLPDVVEFEGGDRQNMKLPQSHLKLIDAVTAANANVVAVVQSGSPVEMDWDNSVKAVVLDYMSGQNGGKALFDVVFGNICPSGRLAETWPIEASDQSSQSEFAVDTNLAKYKESIFVGYRFFDSANVDVKYPFGFGLSYTEFDYKKIELSKNQIEKDEDVTISMEIENTGKYDGSEVVQIYVRHLDNKFFVEDKALKGFTKVHIKKGKKQNVVVTLNSKSFEYFNSETNQFEVDGGNYEIVVAKNVKEPIAVFMLNIKGENSSVDMRETLPTYYKLKETKSLVVSDQEFEKLLGRQLPYYKRLKRQPHTENSTFLQIRDRFFGKILYSVATRQVKKITKGDEALFAMYSNAINNGPLRMLASQGMTRNMVLGLVDIVNGKLFKGLSKILKEQKRLKLEKNQSKKSKRPK